MEKRQKILIIAGVAIVVIAIGIILVIVLTKHNEEETKGETPDFLVETPVNTDSELSVSENSDLKEDTTSASMYYAEQLTNISAVESFISKLGFNLDNNDTGTGDHFSWGSSEKGVIFNYSTADNVLEFNITKTSSKTSSIDINDIESDINKYLKNLGLSYDYSVIKLSNSNGETTVYLSRMIGDYPLETMDIYGATDTLTFSEDGDLIYGKLLFAKLTNKQNYILPLITLDDLWTNINDEEYPKEMRIDELSFLDSTAESTGYEEGEYQDSYDTVSSTIKDCSPDSVSLVYMYPGYVDSYVLPTYKLVCISSATYNNTEYSVSTTVYTNAVSPDYISVTE